MSIDLSKLLEGKRTVALCGHLRPDGDCVGSVMGLYLYLNEYFPDLETDAYLEPIPESYHLISRTEEILSQIPEEKSYDIVFCLDCADLQRMGFSEPLYHRARTTVCIDHHVSNGGYAEVNYIVPDASSTSELVYRILDPEKITKQAAEALYMGIAHDTGIFQYSCTSPETMEAAATLMRKGIDGSEIISKTYWEKTYMQNQILGKALLESILVLDGRCIVSVVRKKEMDFFHAKPSDLDGIVAQLRQTKGVEAALFLYELEPQKFKVSLRSSGKVDVNKVATYYGGGGHVRASGVTMSGSSHDVINNLTSQIEKQLD